MNFQDYISDVQYLTDFNKKHMVYTNLKTKQHNKPVGVHRANSCT